MDFTVSAGVRKDSKFFWIDRRSYVKERVINADTILLRCRFRFSSNCSGRAKANLVSNRATIIGEHVCNLNLHNWRLVEVGNCGGVFC